MELLYFLSLLHLSVQSSVPSSLSPRGSSRWQSSHHCYLPTNVSNAKRDNRSAVFGKSSFFVNYHLAIYVVFDNIPIALQTKLYSIITIKFKSQKIPGEQSVNADEERARRNSNVLKMSIAIVLGRLCVVLGTNTKRDNRSAVFGKSSFFVNYHLAIYVVFDNIPIALQTKLYSIITIKFKSQKIPGEQSVNADEERARRNSNVLKMSIAIVLGRLCVVLGTIRCYQPFKFFCTGHVDENIETYHLLYGYHKLCHKPLYLFYFHWKLSSRS